ncbi:MAG: hypothetical protein J6T10_15980 [Methanobrevibacter sp.]|nr:hypothetical protein [Methanobrevibacter sp.]
MECEITTSTSTQLTLTLTFSNSNGMNGLHLEPTMTGDGWLRNASSCILQPNGITSNN